MLSKVEVHIVKPSSLRRDGRNWTVDDDLEVISVTAAHFSSFELNHEFDLKVKGVWRKLRIVAPTYDRHRPEEIVVYAIFADE